MPAVIGSPASLPPRHKSRRTAISAPASSRNSGTSQSTRALAASAANKASRSLAGLSPGRARRLPAAASAHGSRPSAAAGRQGGSGALHHAEQPGQVVRYLAAAAVAFVIDCRKGVLDVDSGAHRFRGQYLQLKATAGVRCPLDCSETHNSDSKTQEADTLDRVSSRRPQFNDQVIDSHGNGNLSRTCQRGISSNSWR
jgi:hypothetical protein